MWSTSFAARIQRGSVISILRVASSTNSCEGQPLASAIFGTYTALVYFTPIFGGILADRVLGRTNTLILGGLLMALVTAEP